MTVTLKGRPAPLFSLLKTSGGRCSLEGLRGRYVVLYTYPRDDTPGCTSEARSFRDLYPSFVACGAVVLGVSRDSVESHDSFKEKHDLPFSLLSDPEGEVCALYGARGLLCPKRMTFLIDPKGHVLEVWGKVKVQGHAEAVLACLKQHQAPPSPEGTS